MKFTIIADIPDEDIPVLFQALRVVSEDKSFSEMKKCNDNLHALVCSFCAISLHNLFKDFCNCFKENK